MHGGYLLSRGASDEVTRDRQLGWLGFEGYLFPLCQIDRNGKLVGGSGRHFVRWIQSVAAGPYGSRSRNGYGARAGVF